jgi:hypothetical protein
MELNNYTHVLSEEETLLQATTSPGYHFSAHVGKFTAYIMRPQKAL